MGLIKTFYHRAKICSLELFLKETKEIKQILLKNSYPDTVIKRFFNQESKRLKNNIIYCSKKCPSALVLPYISSQSTYFEKTIRRITQKAYYSVKPRVIFKYYQSLTPKG